MGAIGTIIRRASVLVAAGLVAACSSGVAATAAPSPTPAPDPGPVTFTAHETCTYGEITDEDGTWDTVCAVTASDARVSGTGKATIEGADTTAFVGDYWGDAMYQNAAGGWACKHAGSIWSESGLQVREGVCTGSGAYDGLTMYSHATSTSSGYTWAVSGWIEPTPAYY